MALLLIAVCVGMVLTPLLGAQQAPDAPPGAGEPVGMTRILKWKDGRAAAFVLQFDDSIPSHLNTAIPELEKRSFVGTFYINPGSARFRQHEARWKQAAASESVVLANHTFTHVGATSIDQLRDELVRCSEAIAALLPPDRRTRLVAFARPGGVPWTVERGEVDAVLAEYRLVARPPFSGPPITQKSAAELVATVDAALRTGEMGHADFHGVDGDWHSAPLDWYLALLDKLDAERERIWVTDLVSWHQYATQREAATVRPVSAGDAELRVELTATTDAALYDLPLTLQTRVPDGWTTVQVVQGEAVATVEARDGWVMYDAAAGRGQIVLRPVR